MTTAMLVARKASGRKTGAHTAPPPPQTNAPTDKLSHGRALPPNRHASSFRYCVPRRLRRGRRLANYLRPEFNLQRDRRRAGNNDR